MKITNKILAVLLVLVMTVAMIPATFAAGTSYEAETGTTVSVDLTMDNISGFEIHWSDITYSNQNIIASVSGDGSKMNLAGNVYNEGAFYYLLTGSQDAVFTLNFEVNGSVGDTCTITVPYKVVDDGSIYSRIVTEEFTITIIAGHVHSYEWKSNDNQHWKECACGDKIELGDHAWDWVVDTPAGEFTPGVKHEECGTCGATRKENTPIDPTHRHSYSGWKSDDDQHWKECSCGDKIELGAHDWKWVTDTAAGEFTPGKKHEECEVCGATRSLNTPIDPTHQHSYSGWKTNDNQHWKECSCGDKIELGAHDWKWVTDTAAGEHTPGKKHEECEVCGAKRNLNTPITPTHQHSYGGWRSDDDQHWKECSCGDKIELGAHDWNWVIDTAAGEFTPGKKHEECEVCGATRSLNTPIDPTHQHSYSGWKTNDNQHWKECSCGDKIELGAHDWKWVTDTAAGEHTPGKKHEECEVCGAKRNENTVIDPTHQCQFGDWKYNKDGHWKECACGEKDHEGAHTFGKWVTTKYPTATVAGVQERKCDVCGYKQTKKLDPTGETPKPTDPTEPAPTDPVAPTDPSEPTETAPTDPTESAPTDPTVAPTDPSTPGDPTDPTVPGEPVEEDDGCCWWCWLLLLLLLIIIAVLVYIYYRKRKQKQAKRRPNPLAE